MPWNADQTEIVRKRWAEGYSASQIARELGPSFTRNAVIGKITRLKLPGRLAPDANRFSAAARYQGHTTTSRLPFLPPKDAQKKKPVVTDTYVHRETIATPPETWRAFEDVDNKGCRYPHGDQPPFRFCSGKAVPGQPWCPTHFKACAPALAAKYEAQQQSSENLGELEPLQKVQELEGAL